MIEIGKYNLLEFERQTVDGVYLDGGDCGELLLPKEEVPQGYRAGDSLNIFLYCDSRERVVPTIKKPYASVGDFACLTVVDVTEAGAFFDWGLPKDLFIPLCEQKEELLHGEKCIVYIYKEKGRNRIAASSRLDAFLDKESAFFQENEKVNLLICNQTELGYKAIINHSHWGLLYQGEIFQKLLYGQKTEGFIKKVRDDGKIDLSLQIQGYQKMDDLEGKILDQIKKEGGACTVTDKSTPDTIYQLFGVSKKKYKMALGSLYKAKRIIIEADVIKGTD